MKKLLALILALLMIVGVLASCGEILKCKHSDDLADHICDVCGEEIGVHADKIKDGDHRCDYCNAVMSLCDDENNDDLCDECKKKISVDSDKDNNDKQDNNINDNQNDNLTDNENTEQDFLISESFDTETPVTITFYHTMGSSLCAVLNTYIEKFNELYPNITVQYEQPGSYDDVRDKIKAEITVGNQPNIAYCYPDHVATYNIAKAPITLDNLISSTMTVKRADGTTETLGLTQTQIDDFIKGFYDEGKSFGDGKMYSLPLSKSTEVLYYNKTFFEKHNLKVPTTWEEMEETCKKIKELEPKSIPLGYDSESNWFITMCEQYGSPYTSATGDHFLFDNETNHNFVKKFRDWYQKGYVTTMQISGGYTSSLFTKAEGEAGKCYMTIGSSAHASYQRPQKVNGAYPFEVGITGVPQVDKANPKAISQGPSLCIFNKSNPQEVLASWLFVKFLTTNKEFQAEFSMVSGYMPVIKSVKDLDVYKTDFLDKADGGDNVTALSVKVGLENENAYYTSPAFNGSSVARDEVGKLMRECFTANTDNVDATIKKAFEDAVANSIYRAG